MCILMCIACMHVHRCASKRHVRPSATQRPWVSCELTSIQSLLRRVTAHVSRGLQALYAGHVYCGLVDRRYALVPHLTTNPNPNH